jgi:SprT protein
MDSCKYLPLFSIEMIEDLIKEIKVNVKVVNSRKTKLGDFRVINNQFYITINNDLNQYSFLITLVHELAHAYTFLKYNSTVLPHGIQWKNKFKTLISPFLHAKIFPNEIMSVLNQHMENPKASSCTDISLMKVLSKYDNVQNIFIEDIELGKAFVFREKRVFIKIEKLRKRYKCKEIKTNKMYLFSPLAKVSLYK